MKFAHYLFLTFIFVSATMIAQEPVGTAFTYQGYLKFGSVPVQGIFDFEFEIYDTSSAGSQLGSTIFLEDVNVADGLFSVDLDFGSSTFNTEATWLLVRVRDGTSTGNFTELMPRFRITPTPYSIRSMEANNADLLSGLSASDFLRANGTVTADALTVTGNVETDSLEVSEIIFSDGSRQSTAPATTRRIASSSQSVEVDPVGAATEIARFQIPSNTLETDEVLNIQFFASRFSGTNISKVRFRAYYGGSLVALLEFQQSSPGDRSLDLKILIMSNGTTDSQKIIARGTQQQGDNIWQASDVRVSTVDASAAQDFYLTVESIDALVSLNLHGYLALATD